ncbi:hypothetical protein [Filomicrobium sp.]|uniref:hypothetical protein n=1 Tax=Filomicrobium sp. TaxID=2024831 RepID=UPI00258F31FF|nr:hypothetical protein [Filomicrobium sp.]MCV0371092.1 hypothetical protein [Filomicrobium sp.]
MMKQSVRVFGVYRVRAEPENWAIVQYENYEMPIPESRYRTCGHTPEFDDLPWDDGGLFRRKRDAGLKCEGLS